ncbi:glycogen debranching enzyme GlgX [Rhodoferax lacus]|uniref:Glycogen debranching enzyme GlgX n=1 Tax=Rhodoferax lacus TaxID=2184758 RepID=A0A3E1R9N7_9BURK|nr:glycogen debranching protein GlgX [Rhodoferax lacus]RFO95973.1 glycogen debranching enzyme GlgX [Rhodoferax lacus]
MLEPGHAHALGATLQSGGVNFCLAAPNAQAVELCLFDATGSTETARVYLPACTDGIWHGFLPGAQAGLVYGWRVHGPWAPQQGHRFNPAKVVLDPYAREVVGSYRGQDLFLGHDASNPELPDTRDNATVALKARVAAELPAPVPGPVVDPAQRVLYELHIKGFTALHPDVPIKLRGSYAGLAHPAAIAHLKKLGITTVCLMPVAQRADEVRLLNLGLTNYWGYSSVAWSAPENRYWSGTEGTTARSECKAMVDALHQAGLEVILDVVYNHTAETDELGPTLSLRGIDNASYYHLQPDSPAHYMNWTGCGNCVNLNEPLVLRCVMDSLRHWVQAYGVDGFRFDLAPVLARGAQDTQYRFASHAPFLMAVAQDPVLSTKLMVAEPWDIGPGGYQMGSFPPGWLEWNDKFRDTQRAFWLCGQEHLGAVAQRLAGSSESFHPQWRGAHSSVNFITAHDGFTLTDLVSYHQRHNLANGEDNRDGHGHNLSNNFGAEGTTDDAAIRALRLQRKRTLLAATVFSLGTPMLLAGDDLGHSQKGNNNAYCQDNALTWLNWLDADRDLSAFVAQLLQARRARTALQARSWWQPGQAEAVDVPGQVSATWSTPQDTALTPDEWNDGQHRALALRLQVAPTGPQKNTGAQPVSELSDCLLLFNAADHNVTFRLPSGQWLRHINSADATRCDTLLSAEETLSPGCLWLASTQPLFPA